MQNWADKENSELVLYKFTPAVFVCVLSDEGDPVAGDLKKTKVGKINKVQHKVAQWISSYNV